MGKDYKGHLISLVERKLGIGMLFNVGDRKEDKIVQVLDRLEEQFGSAFGSIFKTITFDNGSEFSRSDQMEQGGRTQVYYAHPYSSWERATNENWSGIVRRFIPKDSSFDDLTDEDLARVTHYINTLPRKRFGYTQNCRLTNRPRFASINRDKALMETGLAQSAFREPSFGESRQHGVRQITPELRVEFIK